MKDWNRYIKKLLNEELWGFVLLDYYYKEKENKNLGEPSKFLDFFISNLPNNLSDPVSFHHVFLCVCVHLLGSDFEDITNKTLDLIKTFRERLNEKQIESIIKHYRVYNMSTLISELLKKELLFDTTKATYFGKNNAKGSQEMPPIDKPVKIFYSYSHKDEKLRDEIEKHLKLLEREGYLESWHDRKIHAGSDFTKKIDENLRKADIIFLLISSDFISSDYCYSKEMDISIERHNNDEAIVVPIILRSCDWTSSRFGKLLALPTDGLPIKSRSWYDVDEALTDVAKGIRRIIEERFSP